METLSCLLKRAKEGGYLTIGGVREEVSHLLFANNTLVLVFRLPKIKWFIYIHAWFPIKKKKSNGSSKLVAHVI